MIAYTYPDLLQADRTWRINFINSLIGGKNLHVLITQNANSSYNAAIFNSGLHIGSSPPYVGFLLRPTHVPRHTYENLKRYPYATMNAVSIEYYHQAHATHAKLPYGQSEIEWVGLQLRWEEGEDLPYLKESPLTARLRLVEEHSIEVNQTRLLIFSVEKVYSAIMPREDGFLPLDELGLVVGSGCDAYWRVEFLGRMELERSES